MIESPLIQEILAEKIQKTILRTLTKRFGSAPLEIRTLVEAVSEEPRLDDLLDWAIACPDLDAFRTRLSA